MTVALLGVGADTTNSSPTPPVYQNKHFEYIPIPESNGPAGTNEDQTFGNTELEHQPRSMADYLDYIKPKEDDGPKITGKQLTKWPLHHDPNLDALTYGETAGRSAYLQVLRSLDEGDVVAFYTGLRNPDRDYTHRYIIGYFTIDSITDFQSLPGKESRFNELPRNVQEDIMEDHKDNAHAKRFFATGNIRDDDGLVIIDGCTPGGRLDRAFRISEHRGRGHHYLTDDLQSKFEPETGSDPDKNAYLGGIKQAHRLRISPDRFRQLVE